MFIIKSKDSTVCMIMFNTRNDTIYQIPKVGRQNNYLPTQIVHLTDELWMVISKFSIHFFAKINGKI